jgi:hypothetical protein
MHNLLLFRLYGHPKANTLQDRSKKKAKREEVKRSW